MDDERLIVKNHYETDIILDEETSKSIKTGTKAESQLEKVPGMIDHVVDSKFGNEFTDGNMNTRT